MDDIWADIATRVKDLSSKPEKFLESNDATFEKTKILAKVLYDATKLQEDDKFKFSTLPELIIQDFDEEQVWAGVELQNLACETYFRDSLAKLEFLSTRKAKAFNLYQGATETSSVSQSSQGSDAEEDEEKIEWDESEGSDDDDDDGADLNLEDEEELEEEESDLSDLDAGVNNEDGDEEGDDDEEDVDPEMKEILKDPDFQHMSDSEGDDLPLFDARGSDDDLDLDEDEDEKREKRKAEKAQKDRALADKAASYLSEAMKTMKSAMNPGNHERRKVEDQFFKLDEMETFLEAEEAREAREAKKEETKLKKNKAANRNDDQDDEEDEDEDDDDLDLFDSHLSAEKKEDHAMYQDYFASNETEENVEASGSEDEGMEVDDHHEEDEEISFGKKKQLLDNDDVEDDDQDLGEMKSSFEVRSGKLKKEIKKLEEEALNSKSWQMIGEVNASSRPQNSLLQEHLDYDNVAKQAPIITEKVSRRLEDIIVQRIKDKAWDDVQRKYKPVENPYEYKKRLILDQEKSKLSLAEVYEQEYLKQKGDQEESKRLPGMLDADNDTPPAEVDAIKRAMNSLFAKLDTLTHFHYTPRVATAEVKILRNAPTITMEEVAPITMNDANLLAPQEIIDKKAGEEIGSTERSTTDKKRDRRLKKMKQKLRQKEKEKKEKLVEKLNPGLGNKHSKKKVLRDIEKAEKEGKIVTIKTKSKAVKSSSSFFNQLQNEASSSIKENLHQKKSKKTASGLSGALLKL